MQTYIDARHLITLWNRQSVPTLDSAELHSAYYARASSSEYPLIPGAEYLPPHVGFNKPQDVRKVFPSRHLHTETNY